MGGVELTKINTVIRAATTIVKLQIIRLQVQSTDNRVEDRGFLCF
jgi:hypothetical protein